MPEVRHGETCNCCGPSSASQSLEEVLFSKSICAAARDGNAAKVTALLAKNPSLVDSDGLLNTTGYTPLHYAARAGHGTIVKMLLDAGANPNARTVAGGSTPLHRASHAGHRAIVIMLLDKAADPRIQDEDGQTALHKAAQQGHANVVDVLLRNNSSLANIADNRGRTAEQCKHGFI